MKSIRIIGTIVLTDDADKKEFDIHTLKGELRKTIENSNAEGIKYIKFYTLVVKELCS